MGQFGHSKVILGHSGVILGHLLESCSCAHLMLCLPNVLNFSKLPIFLLIWDSFRFTSKKLESVSCILLISVRDDLKKNNVIFSDIVTIVLDPHPP